MSEENKVDYRENNQKNYTNMALWVIVIFLVITNIFTIFYILKLNKEQAESTDKTLIPLTEKPSKKEIPEHKTKVDTKINTKINTELDTDGDGLSDQDELLKYKTDPNRKDTDGDGYNDGEEIKEGFNPLLNQKEESYKNLGENELFVDWEKEMLIINKMEFFELSEKPVFDKNYSGEFIFDNLKIYKNGIIKNGKYKDGILYLIIISWKGPGDKSFWKVIKKDNNFILLSSKMKKYELETIKDEYYGEYLKKLKPNNKLEIINLGIEEEIKVKNGETIYRRANKQRRFIDNLENYQELYKTKDGNIIYFDKNLGCLLARNNDGLFTEYIQDLKIVALKESISEFNGSIPHLLNITWNNGKKNDIEYISHNFVCSTFGNCLKYAKYIKLEDLKESGVAENGDKIYELKNKNFIEPKSDEAVLKQFFDMSNPYGTKFDQEKYDSFLANHPIIFWQDLFGNFVEFRNAEYQPGVECGKPVIYLYPEKKTDIYVQVSPSGGFTFTEPIYNGGWKVNAKPNGELYNYNDGQKYPYLFWEGKGNNYIRPNKGFVVKKENIKTFLTEKLQKLGLIKKEYDEFIEFWQPKMQEHNYYFITFMPKEDFDKIAPLNIYPQPDKIIRVFMDFEGLDNYIEVEEQKIITPIRNGFTVVEWGGALH